MSLFFVVSLTSWPVALQATTTAHFRIYQVTNMCNAQDDYDPWPANGHPDLRYRMLVRDSNNGYSYHDDCDEPDNRCGTWNMTDYTVTRTLPANTTASFYFGVFDEDDLDADDRVGHHWIYNPSNSMSSSSTAWNNNSGSGYTPTCDNVEGSGYANNYILQYRYWYEDDTGPTSVSTPDAGDDGLTNPAWDNDDRLDFSWGPATDPDTGISGYHFDLYDDTAGAWIYGVTAAPSDRTMTLCPSGCDRALTLVHNHSYRIKIRASNGNYPQVISNRTLWSGDRTIMVDLVDPISAVITPDASSWQTQDFLASISDSDSGAGVDTASCRYRVVSQASTTLDWTNRSCFADLSLTVGPTALCRDQGVNTCLLSVDCQDQARRTSAQAQRYFSIDWEGDPIVSLQAFTEPAGDIIIPSLWVSDSDPYFEFGIDPNSLVAPIAGYSYAIDQSADCQPELAGAEQQSLQLPENSLANGVHTFYVRAIDEAGNCGPEASFEIWVLSGEPLLEFVTLTPNPARSGVELNIQVDSDRELSAPPVVTIGANRTATLVFSSGYSFQYVYSVVGDEVDTDLPSGAALDLVAEAVDLAGNPGSGSSSMIFDFNPPPIEGDILVEPQLLTTGDQVLISFAAAEALDDTPLVTLASDYAAELQDQNGLSYVYAYTFDGTESEGLLEVAIDMTDLAGNQATHLAGCELDLTPPQVSLEAPLTGQVVDIEQEFEILWTTTDNNPDRVSIYLSLDNGQTFDILLADNIQDSGTFSWSVLAEQAGDQARLRIVAYDAVGLQGQAENADSFRIRAPQADHVSLSPTSAQAVAGNPVAIELTVVDQDGLPVAGEFLVTVNLSRSAAIILDTSLVGATSGQSSVSGTTLPDGSASLEVFDDVAEQVVVMIEAADLPAVVGHETSVISFIASQPDYLAVYASSQTVEAGGSDLVTVMIFDALDNPIETAWPVELSVTGLATFTETTLVQSSGLGTALLSGQLLADGTATALVTDKLAETVVVSASAAGLSQTKPNISAEIVFVGQDQIDPALVAITAEPAQIFADGQAYSLVSVTPYDAGGQPLGSGLDVEIFSSLGDLSQVIESDSESGTYTSRLSSTECFAEPAQITARVEDVMVSDGPLVDFICEEITTAELTADPELIVSDGRQCSQLSLKVYDQAGELYPDGQAVEFVITDGSYGEISDYRDNRDGSYSAELCTSECQNLPIRVSARVNGLDLSSLDPPVEVLVEVECLNVDPEASLVKVVPTTVLADGTSAAVITVTPISQLGQIMGAGLPIEIETTLGDLTAVVDEADGTYTAQLTSLESGQAQISATVGGIELDTKPTVEFTPFNLTDPKLESGCGCGTSGADFSIILMLLLMGCFQLRSISASWRSSTPQ
jgi:hypothetical protein